LLGSDLDLRELQRTGRIGRIEVNIKSEKGNSYGELIIPSSLDSTETALIAATLETIERVGPCTAKIILKSVEDTREMKRKFVVEKAKTILKELLEKGLPDTSKITEDIREEIKTHEITAYKGLPCGPNLLDSDDIIIVEGRADVVNLIRYGIKNAIAMEGSSIPQTIIELSKEKITTAFVDGDRGGDLNLKGLLETTDLDYVAVAPHGKEVEELSKKEVFKCIRDKISSSQFKLEKANNLKAREQKPGMEKRYVKSEIKGKEYRKTEYKKTVMRITDDQRKIFKKTLEELIGTRAACIFDSGFNLLGKVPVKELINTLKTVENPYAVIFDGKVDYKLDSIAKIKDIKFLVGMEKEDIRSSVGILSKEDLK